MKQFNALFALLICCVFSAQAQQRYLDEVFSSVTVEADVKYATNISVLTGTPAAEDLEMDVYMPEGDDATDRPVVVYFHTGSFLPPLFNGGVTGARSDSSVVEVCKRLARHGYVAIAATYRAGWNPTATGPSGQNIRTGTLLNAAYRGIQDGRALVRFLHKTVAEEDNKYGINPDKVVAWGQGTGGYLSMGMAFLDDFSEVDLDKFIDTETLLPYVDTSLSGGVYGLEERPLNIVNHPGYPSDIALCVNMGGALGDISWIDGTDEEPVTLGFHVATDPFAPFADGPVIVPTTGDFVVSVSGTRSVVEKVNSFGTNNGIMEANNAETVLNARNAAYANIPFQFPGQNATTLSAGMNMYPFITPGFRPEAGPWDWYDKATLDLVVAGTNAAIGTSFNADTLHSNSLLTNPDMSVEKAKAYIDTVMNYFTPRAYLALQLATDVEDVISAEEVNFQVGPNPATDIIYLNSALETPIKDVALYNLSGKLVGGQLSVNNNYFELNRGNLPAGMYILQTRFDKGIVSKKIMLK